MVQEINRKTNQAVLIVLLASVCTGIFGCNGMVGYSNESLYTDEVRSVYLEMFDSESFRRGVEYDLTDAIGKRLEAESPYKIVSSRDRADTVLSGKIKSIGLSRYVTERETGRALEQGVEVVAVVNWKNLKTGAMLIDNKQVSSSASYSEWQSQGFDYGATLAANKLSRIIVELMENQW